jgi:hypothetical protein
MKTTLFAAAAATLMAFGTGAAVAALPSYETMVRPPSEFMPSVGSTVLTPNGSATITGSMGSSAIATFTGGGTGVLSNNGNGTSTLSVPGGAPATIPSGG